MLVYLHFLSTQRRESVGQFWSHVVRPKCSMSLIWITNRGEREEEREWEKERERVREIEREKMKNELTAIHRDTSSFSTFFYTLPSWLLPLLLPLFYFFTFDHHSPLLSSYTLLSLLLLLFFESKKGWLLNLTISRQ